MILAVTIVSIIAYCITLIAFRGKYIEQQLTYLIIFLVGLTLVGELDILLPVYFVFSFLPFLRHIKKISVFTFSLIIYFSVYLIYGLFFQDMTGTLITFICKIWQFLVFFIVFDVHLISDKSSYKQTIKYAFLIECLLGIYLIINSSSFDSSNGLVRLVSNAQPITGNLSTAVLPVIVIYYFSNRSNASQIKWLLQVSVGMLIWIVLSGTRGYTLEYVGTMFLVFYDYFFRRRHSKITQSSRIAAFTALGIGIILVVIFVPGKWDRISSVLRLKSSLGIRTFENRAILEFISTAPIYNLLFGIGIGGTGGNNAAMRDALNRQLSMGMWNRSYYLSNSGALFHNLYANIVMCLGLFGLFLFVILSIRMWRIITVSCYKDIRVRRIMHLFQLSFLLMNYYRWSAVCGIAEMIIFALVLKHYATPINHTNEECLTTA